ncbi:phage tail assembly chaperone [Pseudomonas chlororaphis]|uniref:phage tail assembly chaperone n=1 Tax=Pseudomonas chlororaphis TaxID=587753 RepID=UPI000F6F9E69|nr:phage tail assembly chaperone [Pseudomonas chlororaphis]AZD14189.1 Phage protein [Pseudomonas chlororaphis]WDH48672.1 phage tail assembly chaperone [Pseudomonas chlororaphis]WDH60522.1 phage tail assembly chaperone [Pseudomonas chlororaphis]WQE19776.1 phage tail assembly chaperone [Pseudomonas chlororaphis]
MKIYFFAKTLGFDVVASANEAPPEGAVEISQAEYAELFAGQGVGKRIVANDNGAPILVDPAGPSPEQLISIERAWRDSELLKTDALVARHRDELESQAATTLSDADYNALQAYRCDLRSWPKSRKFPAVTDRPVLRMTSGTTGATVKRKRVRKPVQMTESV